MGHIGVFSFIFENGQLPSGVPSTTPLNSENVPLCIFASTMTVPPFIGFLAGCGKIVLELAISWPV
jgi:hypothetical protein